MNIAKEQPILFSAEMVRAILRGEKTQTRRVIKPQPPSTVASFVSVDDRWKPVWQLRDFEGLRSEDHQQAVEEWQNDIAIFGGAPISCPYGKPGDRLWVKEGTWCYDFTGWGGNNQLLWPRFDDDPARGRNWFDKFCEYEADDPNPMNEPIGLLNKLFMPRWASRITLEITDTRVERVQDISNHDVMAEGVKLINESPVAGSAVWDNVLFVELWDSINAERGYGWDANPWVWVIEFRRMGL